MRGVRYPEGQLKNCQRERGKMAREREAILPEQEVLDGHRENGNIAK